ncbi:MAG: 3D domain-containing protein [Oscillospiraceae bacterium]
MIRSFDRRPAARHTGRSAVSALLTLALAVCLLGVTYADALDTRAAWRFSAPQDLTGRVFFTGLAEDAPEDYRFSAGGSLSLLRRDLSLPVVTEEETVAELLHRLDISLEEDEAVLVDFTGDIPALSIASDFTCEVEWREPVACATRYEENSSLAWGEETVVQEGRDGYIPHTSLVWVENGRATVSFPLFTGDSTAQDEIIQYGTRSKNATVQVLSYTGGTVNVNGQALRYSKCLRMTGTAYTAGVGEVDTVTATGTTVHVGVVAVDRRVIPLGSRLYIETARGSYVYGVAVAEDTGVKGNVIDLYMASYADCVNFGRRAVNVYILES